MDETAEGMPHDAAVAISRSRDVQVRGCQFLALGGSGVVVGNASRNVSVESSTFVSTGQSAIIMVGNASTQPSDATIANNTIDGVGQMLASAGGVVISSASNVRILRNNISRSSRWGIAVRSNHEAPSANNTIEGNRVAETGLLTADFGAISFIDHESSHDVQGNVIRGNGMRDARFRGEFGTLLSPFWGRAVYLDDRTSNVDITSNVFVNSSHAAIFVHSGSRNTMRNNVFYDAADMSVLMKTITHGNVTHMASNVVERNAFFSHRSADDPASPPMFAGPTAPSPLRSALTEAGHNLYFRPGVNLQNPKHAKLFLGSNWSGWLAEGYGNGSLIGVNPGFVDASGGNFELKPDSPLREIGFESLPITVC